MLFFYLAAAGIFFAFEYSTCYYIVNSVHLSGPIYLQRVYGAARFIPFYVNFCLGIGVSTSFPLGLAKDYFGFDEGAYSQSIRLSVNSIGLGYGGSYNPEFPCPSYPESFGAFYNFAVQWSTFNSTLIRELNTTGTQHLTLVEMGSYRTNYYNQQITRSMTIDCAFGPITGSAQQQPSTCSPS